MTANLIASSSFRGIGESRRLAKEEVLDASICDCLRSLIHLKRGREVTLFTSRGGKAGVLMRRVLRRSAQAQITVNRNLGSAPEKPQSPIKTSCSICSLKHRTHGVRDFTIGIGWRTEDLLVFLLYLCFLLCSGFFCFPVPFDWEVDSRNIWLNTLQKHRHVH